MEMQKVRKGCFTKYSALFPDDVIEDAELEMLVDIAVDTCIDICLIKPTESDMLTEDWQKAVAWQVKMLYDEGGADAVLGSAESAMAGVGESLGDYSISSRGTSSSSGDSNSNVKYSKDGIPVSNYTIILLRRMGLMQRWAYAQRGDADAE